MPTVKMSDGKVVTKEGKVSCSCCSSVCCMYRADYLGVYYGDDDLPDAITLLGVGSLSRSGNNYGDTENGVIFESGVWARYISGIRSTKLCLIDDDGNYTPGDDKVEDQFAPTYIVTVLGMEISVNRVSLCEWTGSTIIPFYGWEDLCAGDTFNVSLYFGGFLQEYIWTAYVPGGILIKYLFQTMDTPEGVYETYALPQYRYYADPVTDCPNNPGGGFDFIPDFTVSLP